MAEWVSSVPSWSCLLGHIYHLAPWGEVEDELANDRAHMCTHTCAHTMAGSLLLNTR